MRVLISAHSADRGEQTPITCSLDVPVTLGRGPDSPLLLDGTGISREHVRLNAEDGRLFITDLSSNGTWLNARRLSRGEPHPLAPTDAIRIPGFEIRIRLQGASDAKNATAARGSDALPEAATAKDPLAAIRGILASLSAIERVLIVLALGALALVIARFTQ